MRLLHTSRGFISATILLYGALFLLTSFAGYLRYQEHKLEKSNLEMPTATPTSVPLPTIPVPTQTPKPVTTTKKTIVDSDPIVNCVLTSNCGGGVQQMRKSQCDQAVCCQLGANWSLYPSKTACTDAQNNSNSGGSNYPPCIVYYPGLDHSQTYNYVSPAQCALWQQQANTSAQNLKVTPVPTVEPYQYSQEYLNSINNFNNTINENYQPTQFVAPTTKCYASWDEYFNAHPNYAPQDIKGTSVNPPCD